MKKIFLLLFLFFFNINGMSFKKRIDDKPKIIIPNKSNDTKIFKDRYFKDHKLIKDKNFNFRNREIK